MNMPVSTVSLLVSIAFVESSVASEKIASNI